MKLTFDEKVTPYSYCVGGIVLLNDPVEKVVVSGKLGGSGVGLIRSHGCPAITVDYYTP